MAGKDTMIIEMCNCQSLILGEIANPKMKRNDVSQTYAWALRSTENIDWARINEAIIARWSLHALEWIKKRAWSGKCFTGDFRHKLGMPPDGSEFIGPERSG